MAEQEVQEAMMKFELDPSSQALRMEMNKTTTEYLLRLKMEEDFWRQKAAVKWVAEGERNTRFFQGWVKQKRTKTRIHMIEDLLSSDVGELGELELDSLNSLPPDVEMEALERTLDKEEVRKIVFDISTNSASGPDGYSSLFFQACWGIIRADVVEAVVEFFHGVPIPRGIEATILILLQKKRNPTKWLEFRPISLCNVMNKIISKLLAVRMAPLLPMITVPNQSGFIKFCWQRNCSMKSGKV
ncbi:uncharacterized protein LOC121760525 [Salvia splendens]|uniref:uncharacterized protein LOC121760525 n=1 Tax=Salvia splendens TaxID=180675 RepID=UPI001C252DBC|nr:uncharacterized protein LOC121760525 [Salvia splendens]